MSLVFYETAHPQLTLLQAYKRVDKQSVFCLLCVLYRYRIRVPKDVLAIIFNYCITILVYDTSYKKSEWNGSSITAYIQRWFNNADAQKYNPLYISNDINHASHVLADMNCFHVYAGYSYIKNWNIPETQLTILNDANARFNDDSSGIGLPTKVISAMTGLVYSANYGTIPRRADIIIGVLADPMIEHSVLESLQIQKNRACIDTKIDLSRKVQAQMITYITTYKNFKQTPVEFYPLTEILYTDGAEYNITAEPLLVIKFVYAVLSSDLL